MERERSPLSSTRRALLRNLAAAPIAAAAISLPVPMAVAEPADATADVGVIELAEQALDLIRREDEARCRLVDVEEQYAAQKPAWPTYTMEHYAPGQVFKLRTSALLRANLAGAEELPQRPGALDGLREEIATMERFEAECAALEIRLGLPETREVADTLFYQIDGLVRRLAFSRASTTMAGLQAKAKVYMALEQGGMSEDAGACFLASMLIREIVLVGDVRA